MKKIVPLILTVMAACSAPKDISVRLLGAHPLDNECAVEDFNAYQTGGSINLAYTSRYIAGFGSASDLQLINTEVGEDVLQGPSRNDFYSEMQVTRYVAYPDGVEIGREEIPVLGTIGPATDGSDSHFSMDLIGPATYSEIYQRGTAQPFEMQVEVFLKGKLYSGAEVQTNKVTFPLSVYNFERTCTLPQVLDVDTARDEAPCRNVGQDGVEPQCVDP